MLPRQARFGAKVSDIDSQAEHRPSKTVSEEGSRISDYRLSFFPASVSDEPCFVSAWETGGRVWRVAL